GKIYKHKYPNFQSPLTRNFTIRYRAYSGATCVNDRLRTITVNAAPLVQFNNMPDVCLDAAPFQITQASEIGGVPGTGVFSGPGVNGTGTFNPASVGPGTYLIKYTFTSSAGGCVDTLSKPITVLDSASAQFTYSTLNCEGSPVSFNSSSSTIPPGAGTITGWTWNFGDPASGAANTSTLQNPTHLFSGWGTYTVTLSVTTSNGCRSTLRSIPVFVNPIPRPNFTMPASSCLPAATVAFNSAPSTIADGTSASFTYLWNFGDPASGALNTSTNSSPSHIYNSVGPFNVNLQITSGVGCVHDTTILLNTIHPQPTGSFTADKTEVCVGAGTFTFTDNSDPEDGTTVQWSWNMDDGNVRNTPVVVNYNFSTPRTYNVSLFTVNSHGCRSTTFTLPVTVHPYPVVDAGPDRIMLEGGQIVLEPAVTGNDLTYLWTPALPGYFAGSNAVKNPAVNGIDDITLTLTVTARGGCQDDDQVFIKILKFPSIPNIFSPNGDGVHDRWEIPYLNTYPGSTVDIYNRYGQLIFHSDGYNVPWDGTVKGQPVPVGTYYYIVNPKNGRKLMSGYVDVIR
ncbi:MAG: gliding motility-associated C-terminal domain-containing protein, partial [Chitinophagaceae bacterium]|nr:gliding motility-associated C-terminal domain-containing protein [Chitinophagaceae bacterium]